MTVIEFFTESPWIAWPLAVLYAVLCVVIAISIKQLFWHNK